MTATSLPEFTITCSSRRRACVLDPGLALSIYGLPIAKQLGEWLELWIVRDCWDGLGGGASGDSNLAPQSPSMERAMKEWERLRQHVDNHHRPVNVLADVLGDSSIPSGSDPDLIWRWESLAQALDQDLSARGIHLDGPGMARRDLAALAAARSASILTLRGPAVPKSAPALCQSLETWGIPCVPVPARNDLRGSDSAALRHLFVHAGLASLLWAGMDLCVVHLFVPAAATLGACQPWMEYSFPLAEAEDDSEACSGSDRLWEGAEAFWYPLTVAPAASETFLSPQV